MNWSIGIEFSSEQAWVIYSNVAWGGYCGAHLRHSQRGNMAFFDGHAEVADIGLLKKADFNRVMMKTQKSIAEEIIF